MIRKARDYLLKHKTSDVVLLVVITLVAASKWFNLDIPKGHDALGDMLLAQAASHTFSLHNLLTGWSSDWSLGYPLFYVSPPLVSCLIWALSYLFGWILSTKLLYLSLFVLSGVFAYFYMSELTKNRPASFVAGLAYVFLPYHILEVGFEAHHGALGLPYMLTPLILLCLERLIQKPRPRYALINGVLLALLTLTYPQVFPILVGPFLALYVALRIWWEREKGVEYFRRIAICIVVTFFLPVLLTAFWWLPLLSDIRYFAATSFPPDAAREYSATFLQAIALRPAFCCAPASAYGSSIGIPLQMLRLLPFVLVVLGVILNYRNRYVWFFSASVLIAVMLAMGPDSPINLFSLAHRYVPFFSGLRTPWRFLLFTSLAYAVLIGFCVKGVTEWLGRLHPRRLRRPAVPVVVLVLTSLIVLGNTWQETRTAFDTFTLTKDQRNAFAWLKAQDSGDYRIADPPFDPYVYNADAGYTIKPSYWTYLHGKENVFGSTRAVKYALSVIESLNADLTAGPVDMSQWFSIFNVKYILLDKTDPIATNLILGTDSERVWSSETIDIYENHAMKPRVFSVSSTDRRDIALWSAGTINVFLVDGSEDVAVSLDNVHTRSSSLALEARFQLSGAEAEQSRLGIDVGDMTLGEDDAVHLVFHSEHDLPNVHVSLDALESDGSQYGMDLSRVDGIRAGWNEITLPLSLLLPRHPIGEGDQLDFGQIKAIGFGVGQKDGTSEVHEFSLYFDSLSVVSQEINTDAEYAQTGPGEYQVHVKSDSPFRLILSESYYPNWVARVNGTTIHSEITYESLNGFDLQAGDYDVTLEFVPSTLRTVGIVISGISTLLILLVGVVLLMRWRSSKTQTTTSSNATIVPTAD